ncbi:efflux RND transporter periplasmic adaptor subunit [Caldisalinibacter kiritimatiensis]|uniref:Putative Co/Zn/Cd efflux system membrane fusion protein n=1 Tax=Caldisalinibacter kiritimatiensis TaxID=1304284 RepID=R1CP16_9FIRM|nr:efflux RND transporter periplasmic adaptor subunit [Caldisalinibacter kiritimatiensis]EOD00441.1 Putative Co/Zn/Cd efflux system membrane fusion protein [Caldisalinibacter kiritimatiensis]
MANRILMIIVILAIVVFGGFYAYNELMPEEVEETQGPVYATKEVTKGDISVGVETTGRLDPSRGGSIRVPEANAPSLMGVEYIIDEIMAEEGTEVKQGDTIVKLISSDIEDKIEKLKEDIEYQREDLSHKTGVPIDEIDNINPYQGLTITAPIAGKVVGINAEEGKKIDGQATVAKIVDDSKFKVEIKLTPSEFKKVEEGEKVLLSFPYFDGFYEGTIKEVNPNPVPNQDTQDGFGKSFVHWVTIEAENPGLVQPKMEVNVGLPGDNNMPKYNFMYTGEVVGFVDEEKVLNPVSDEVVATKVHVHEMQIVEKGEPILTMAGPDVRDMIQKEVDKLRELKSQLESLLEQKEKMEIKATMDGIVARIYREKGESVRPGEYLGSVYTTDEMRIWTQVDDIDVVNVKQGAPVRVTVDAVPGETFEGTVEHVSTSGRTENGVTRFHVEIRVNGGPQLRPGMEAKAFIDAGSAEDVLLVPLEAVFEEDGQTKVEILENGTPKLVTVKLGLMNDRYAEVKSGLEEGDLVITGSTADLLPSQHIKSQDSLLPTNGDSDSDNENDSGTNNGQ